MSRIAAIVPSLGRSALAGELLRTLRAELAATAPASEIVWVQQGEAAPPALVAPRERLVSLSRPIGFAAAVNAGFACLQAGTELVAVLNDDLVLEPGWLPALVDELERRPRAAAVQGVALDHARPELCDGCGIGWNRDWQAVQIGHGETPPRRDAPPFEVFGVSATAALYRVAALWAVAQARAPLFDERLGSYYEDVELAVRLRNAGFESWCVPTARARHAGQATTGRAPRERWRQIYRNRRWVAEALLGERFATERERIASRDRRDFARRLLAFDLAALSGIAAGLRAAQSERPFAPAPGGSGEREIDSGRALAAAERLAVGSRW